MTVNDKIEDIKNRISVFNNKLFIFDPVPHEYTYDKKKLVSATTYIKQFKTPFDRIGKATKKAKELGKSTEEVLSEWDSKSKIALELGTKVHQYIEDYYNGIKPPIPEDDNVLERVCKFHEIYNKRLNKLIPLQSELRVFCLEWGICGTMDQPYLLIDGENVYLIIGDWKTDGKFTHDEHEDGRYRKLLFPFEDLWENKLNEYSIQLTLYKLMLKRTVGIEVHSGFLCHIGPDGPAKIYKIKDLEERLESYLDSNNMKQ